MRHAGRLLCPPRPPSRRESRAALRQARLEEEARAVMRPTQERVAAAVGFARSALGVGQWCTGSLIPAVGIDEETFSEAVEERDGLLVVGCWAEGEQESLAVMTATARAVAHHTACVPDQPITLLSLPCDTSQDLARHLQVASLPTLLFVNNSSVLHSRSGLSNDFLLHQHLNMVNSWVQGTAFVRFPPLSPLAAVYRDLGEEAYEEAYEGAMELARDGKVDVMAQSQAMSVALLSLWHGLQLHDADRLATLMLRNPNTLLLGNVRRIVAGSSFLAAAGHLSNGYTVTDDPLSQACGLFKVGRYSDATSILVDCLAASTEEDLRRRSLIAACHASVYLPQGHPATTELVPIIMEVETCHDDPQSPCLLEDLPSSFFRLRV